MGRSPHKGSSKSPSKSKKSSSSQSDEKSPSKSKKRDEQSVESSSSDSSSDTSPSKRYAHPKYTEMVLNAIFEDASTKGTTRPTIKKFILENYKVDQKLANGYITKALHYLIDQKVLQVGSSSVRWRFTKKGRESYKQETGRKSPKKKSRAPRKKRDPNLPKKANSAWIFFAMETRKEIQKKHPKMTFGELSKRVGKRWSKLDESEREKWDQLALKDKKRYERELKAYDKRKAEESSSSGSRSDSDSSSDESESETSKEKRERKERERQKEKKRREKEKEKEKDKEKEKEKDKEKDKKKGGKGSDDEGDKNLEDKDDKEIEKRKTNKS